MKNKLKDSLSQTIPEKKEIFNTIDEYESHLNDNIKDSLSVFINATNNIDILNNISSIDKFKKEMNISINLELLLFELSESKLALGQIEETIKKILKRKVKKI